MQFLTAQQELAGQLGMDISDSATLTRVKRWLNLSRKDIEGYYDWEWLKSTERVALETDYTTGTVTIATDISLGFSELVFSGAIAQSKSGWYIQFSTSNDWYKIVSHTATSTSAVIEPRYALATESGSVASLTFTIRKLYYSFPISDPITDAVKGVEKIYACKQANSPSYVSIIDSTKYDSFVPFSESTGPTKSIITWGYDSSGNVTFTPYPFPDSQYLLEFRTIIKTNDLSGDTDTPLFPQRFDSVWLKGSEFYGYKFMNNIDMSTNMYKIFKAECEELKDRDDTGLSRLRVVQGIDGGGRNVIVPFPDKFGSNQ